MKCDYPVCGNKREEGELYCLAHSRKYTAFPSRESDKQIFSQNDPGHSGPCPGCHGYFHGDYPMEHRNSQCPYRYVSGQWVSSISKRKLRIFRGNISGQWYMQVSNRSIPRGFELTNTELLDIEAYRQWLRLLNKGWRVRSTA